MLRPHIEVHEVQGIAVPLFLRHQLVVTPSGKLARVLVADKSETALQNIQGVEYSEDTNALFFYAYK